MFVTHSLHVDPRVGFSYFNSWIHATGSTLLTLILEMEISFTPTHTRSGVCFILFFPLSHLPLFLATPMTIKYVFSHIDFHPTFLQPLTYIFPKTYERRHSISRIWESFPFGVYFHGRIYTQIPPLPLATHHISK